MQTKYRKLNYEYDRALVLEEIYNYESKFFSILALKDKFQNRPFSLVPDEFYDMVEARESYDTSNGKKISGTLSSWKGFNFTHIPGIPSSIYGRNFDRNNREESWEWRPEIKCTYLKKITQDLGFKSVQNVRAMIIYPGGFGPVHCDTSTEQMYYKDHVSVTLNLEDGGQPLVAQIDGEFYELNDPCFIFEDDCWHGVGQVTSRRTQVRINGIVDTDILNSYLI